MLHDCKRYLVETANIYTTEENKISYKVFICEDCKKYYIKRFGLILEVQFDHKNQNWFLVTK